jgi:hypothetical protein
MKTSVTTIEVATQEFDSVITQVNTRVVPTVRDLPGFKGAYWFGDRSAGLIQAVEFFDSEENLLASNEQARRSTAEALSSISGRVTADEEYEVVATTGLHVNRTAQFCRSLVWQEDPLEIERAIRRIEEDVIPGVQQNPGFQGGFWLMDRLTGRSMGFTLWATAEHLRLSGDIGRKMRQGPIQRGLMQVLGLHEYEIVARDEAP